MFRDVGSECEISLAILPSPTPTGLQKNDEMWMFQHLDDGDLARQELVEIFGRRIPLLDHLDGDVCLMPVGVRQLHVGVRATAEHLHHAVAMVLEDRVSLLVARAAGVTGGLRASVGRHGRCRVTIAIRVQSPPSTASPS